MNEQNEQNESNNGNNKVTDLHKLIYEDKQSEKIQTNQQDTLSQKPDKNIKMDIMNLPPRKEIHSNHKKRIHVKLSRPLFRFLSVIIILLVIIYGAYFIWGNELLT